MRIIIVGTYPPRQCGIATFTHDLYRSLRDQHQHVDICAIADGTEASFPSEVRYSIPRDTAHAYQSAADNINLAKYDCCIIQHEFGIFGDNAGQNILLLAERLAIPIITNLHTVLETPSLPEYRVLKSLANLSSRLTVMTDRAISMLDKVYEISSDKVSMIPHGIPAFNISTLEAKKKLGLTSKKVMLSFGLLGPSKGYEVSIEAVANITDPDFIYIILGATHPNVLRHEGERYKNKLTELTAALGLEERVLFVNEYASDEQLQVYLKACDLYVTPYPNVNQISSGTLTFALGAGAAVLSTPYWYAQDLLAHDRGILFGFDDPAGLAHNINELLADNKKMERYRRNAAAFGETISWSNIAKKQIELAWSLLQQKHIRSQTPPAVRQLEKRLKPTAMNALFPSGKLNEDRRFTI